MSNPTIMKPLSIAVIGGGPSGLFFCHAMEYMMKQTGKQVSVTCFEKSSQPGGIWRAADPNSIKETTQMYEQLWTNGASHLTEFFDYTYDEHFGRPVSVYMKRQDLLGYILGRVQKNCPDFLEKYVEFQTLVEHVVYDDEQKQFNISVKCLDSSTPVTEIRHFDKCIWACGENGRRNIPESLVRLFRDGGFQGRIIHSADTASLEADVKGKNILLVGGGLSAEDLVLQAIKLQVKKIYVSTRTKTEICWTKKWPMNKVKVLLNQAPVSVTENGKCIQFMEMYWTPDGYERDGDEIESEIRNIDTVILCTGYDINLDMLDPSLRPGFPKGQICKDEYLQVPDDFTMPPNALTKYVGEVPIGKVRYYACYIHPSFHRGVLISNPKMMFISTYGAHVPLMACDAFAWLLASYATGVVPIPSPSEMRKRNTKEALEYLKMPYFRYLMDSNYFQKVDKLQNFWPEDPNKSSPVWEEVEYDEYPTSMKVLARVMQEGKYPFSLGSYEELNENAEIAMMFGNLSYYHRANLKPVGDEKNWKTFRDYDDADQFYSLLTGTKAVLLEKPWMFADVVDVKENVGANSPTSKTTGLEGDCSRRLKI
jgi:thioredoxin reductase